MTPERGEALVSQAGDVAALRESYRGWAGYEAPEVQALEREAFVREGWNWAMWPQQGEIVVQDRQRGTFVRIDAYPASGPAVTYSGWVDNSETITTLEETNGEPVERQTYRVAAVQHVNGGQEAN